MFFNRQLFCFVNFFVLFSIYIISIFLFFTLFRPRNNMGKASTVYLDKRLANSNNLYTFDGL